MIFQYNYHMKRLGLFLLLGCFCCDGGNNDQACFSGNSSDPVRNQLVCSQNQELAKQVSFTLSGQAACSDCVPETFPVAGLYVNVFPADAAQNPLLEAMATTMTGGLGPFELHLTAEKGSKLRVDGQLYRESSDIVDPVTIESSVEITTPNEDGEVVAFTLNFPEE